MASQKTQYLRCAAPFVTATYFKYASFLRELIRWRRILSFLLCHYKSNFMRVAIND